MTLELRSRALSAVFVGILFLVESLKPNLLFCSVIALSCLYACVNVLLDVFSTSFPSTWFSFLFVPYFDLSLCALFFAFFDHSRKAFFLLLFVPRFPVSLLLSFLFQPPKASSVDSFFKFLAPFEPAYELLVGGPS